MIIPYVVIYYFEVFIERCDSHVCRYIKNTAKNTALIKISDLTEDLYCLEYIDCKELNILVITK